MKFRYDQIFYKYDVEKQALISTGIYAPTEDEYKNDKLNLKTINSYNDFLDVIKVQTRNYLDTKYYVFFNNNDMTIFYSDIYDDMKFLINYEIENENILKLFKDLLNLGPDDSTILIASSNNNYNFILPHFILNFFLTEIDLKSKGEETFRTFKLKTKNDKVRDITAPHDEIKVILREMNRVLQKKYDGKNSNFQVAYKKNKNIVDNASLHVGNKYVYSVDLKDFFPSCKRENVRKILKFLFEGCPNQKLAENMFLDSNLKDEGLFIGSPISGVIANAILAPSMRYLNRMCSKVGIALTVYADDITFSSKKFIVSEVVFNMLKIALAEYELDDFKLNDKKSRGMTGTRRHVTGVSINNNNEMTMRRVKYNLVRNSLYRLSKDLPIKTPMNKLKGLISFGTMINKEDKLGKLLVKYEDTLLKYKLMSSEKLEELKGIVMV